MRRRPPYVFGHRGFSGRYPENTMESFEAAIELCCDGVEFDVQLTRDGVPVILHDETLLRTGNVNAAVKDLTLSELAKSTSPTPTNSKVRFRLSAFRRLPNTLRACAISISYQTSS